jgi:hypothetical protein
MSGLLPKADIRRRIEHVCLVPLADMRAWAPQFGLMALHLREILS